MLTNWMKWIVLGVGIVAPASLAAQQSPTQQSPAQQPPAEQPATQQSGTPPSYDNERRVNLAEPDFAVVTVPTTLRMPRFKSSFRMTHRFSRPLGEGSFGNLAADLFGLDSGGTIGLEYRFGVVKGGQVGIQRTNNQTIEFFGQYDLLRRASREPFNLHLTASVEGTNNFRDHYTPAAGAVLSFRAGDRVAVYAAPNWVHRANLFPSARTTMDEDALLLGLGGRVRVRPTVYVVGEVTPRVAGYSANTHQGSFGIEKRAGGHTFQLNVSNGFGTTPGQIARGGTGSKDWYIGFNLTRKFF